MCNYRYYRVCKEGTVMVMRKTGGRERSREAEKRSGCV